MRFTLTLLILSALFLGGCDTNTAGCKDDYDCESDRVCRLADGLCEQMICKKDTDCPGDSAVCKDNRCLTVCTTDADCGTNFTCIESVCEQ